MAGRLGRACLPARGRPWEPPASAAVRPHSTRGPRHPCRPPGLVPAPALQEEPGGRGHLPAWRLREGWPGALPTPCALAQGLQFHNPLPSRSLDPQGSGPLGHPGHPVPESRRLSARTPGRWRGGLSPESKKILTSALKKRGRAGRGEAAKPEEAERPEPAQPVGLSLSFKRYVFDAHKRMVQSP